MKRFLAEVAEDGAALIPDDGSRWDVSPGDAPTVITWMPTAELAIRPHRSNDPFAWQAVNREINITISLRSHAQ